MLYSHPISTPLGVTVAGNGNHGGSGEVMRFGGSAPTAQIVPLS